VREQKLPEPVLRIAMQEWLHRVREAYWCPLEDAARIVFREVFCAKCKGGLHAKVERDLAGGKHGFTVEGHLTPLANGDPASKQPGDITVLYRLLEVSSSRAVDSNDLWRVFCSLVDPSADPKAAHAALKHRFGYGVLSLHAMGLISPQSGGKSTGWKTSTWRFRKRHFGRVWLKAKDTGADGDFATLCAAVPETAAEVQLALRPDSIAQEEKQIPAWAQRWLPESMRGEGHLPSLLKRAPMRPTSGFDPTAKRARGGDRSRPKLFFGH